MTEMKFKELYNSNKCPAEYAREVEGINIPLDCEACGYDCRVCVDEAMERDRYRQ